MLGASEGCLAIDDLILAKETSNQMIECLPLREWCTLSMECEFFGVVELLQLGDVFPAIDPGESLGAEQIGFVARGRHPMAPIVGRPTTCDNAMQMIVFAQGLAPCVKDAGNP